MAVLTVIRPGMLTTVQDLGRWGSQAHGVPVAGPMDLYSHKAANRLVGNSEHAAAIEVTLIGPALTAGADVVCAVAGAHFDLRIDGQPAPTHAPFVLQASRTLRFGNRLAGARVTLAVRGGIDVPPLFGSRSTSIISRMGPFGGRALVAGDVLTIGDDGNAKTSGATPRPLPLPQGGARVRVMLGPHDDLFTSAARETLVSARYRVTPQSNRMGYRLEGPPLRHVGGADILSDATPIGSLQVPASGQPILLMADRQTTGGYAKIATVITADLPIAGQLAPGDWIEFSAIGRTDALDALKQQEARLAGHE
jgi:antagonist of KipI